MKTDQEIEAEETEKARAELYEPAKPVRKSWYNPKPRAVSKDGWIFLGFLVLLGVVALVNPMAALALCGIAGGALIYFLPAIIAHQNGKRNAQAIFVLNLVAGWTFVGWVVALVWANTKD